MFELMSNGQGVKGPESEAREGEIPISTPGPAEYVPHICSSAPAKNDRCMNGFHGYPPIRHEYCVVSRKPVATDTFKGSP